MKKYILVVIVAIIALLIGAGVTSALNEKTKTIFKPTNRGTWLYVGGYGPDNYTSIQDAINDAIDGDTVFVYDDSSPYYENVVINKSITLLGENKSTTIIDALHYGYYIILIAYNQVSSGFVSVEGFTITNSTRYGIYVSSPHGHPDRIYIQDNIIKNNDMAGVELWTLLNDVYYSVNDNDIEKNEIGIDINEGNPKFIEVLWNNIRFNNIGINIIKTNCNYFAMAGNIIYNNTQGLYIEKSTLINLDTNDNIELNHFEKNDVGIYLSQRSILNKFSQNNFINNTKHVFYKSCFINRWNENYWDNWIGLKGGIWSWMPKIIIGRYGPIPWPNFDWYPASKPYILP